MKKNLTNLILLLSVATAPAACTDPDSVFTVRRECVDVGLVSVGDSVSATFTFKNNTRQDMVLSLLPECDCTVVTPDCLELAPRRCGQAVVKVAVEQSGPLLKYVYVQVAGTDMFMTVSVKGHAK